MKLVTSRRSATILAAAAAASLTSPHAAFSLEESRTIVSGIITADEDLSTTRGNDAALYVTARPAPTSSLAAGKVPPLATKRYAGPVTFPYTYTLESPGDLTPEYANVPREEWDSQDLLIAARLDMDGVAATRGPDDLVGRTLARKQSDSTFSAAPLALRGRGVTGKLLTGGK